MSLRVGKDQAAAATGARALLELHDVQASYGPYRALFGVSFSVAEHSAVALVGSNGSGKTTVARVVSGLVRPSAGSVVFDGREVTRWPPWRIARAGLVHAPEGRSVLASLTVEENLLLGLPRSVGRRGQDEVLERAYSAFRRLGERRRQPAGTLSGGEQRMLSLAKVLGRPQRLLVVDELSLGLAPAVVDDVFGALGQILASGTSLLVVEQHVERVLELADRVVVLAHGRVADEGSSAEVAADLSRLRPVHDAVTASGDGTRQQPGGEPDFPSVE